MTVLKQNFYSKSPIYYFRFRVVLRDYSVDFNIKTFKKYIIIGNFEHNEGFSDEFRIRNHQKDDVIHNKRKKYTHTYTHCNLQVHEPT